MNSECDGGSDATELPSFHIRIVHTSMYGKSKWDFEKSLVDLIN